MKIKLLCFAQHPDFQTLAFLNEAGVFVETTLPSLNFSDEIVIRHDGAIELYDAQVVSLFKDGLPEELPAPIVSLAIPKNLREARLILTPNKGGSTPYIPRLLQLDEDSMPRGSVLYYNLTDHNMLISLDKNKKIIPVNAGSLEIVEGMFENDSADRQRNRLFLQIASDISGEWRLFNSTQWTFDKRFRRIIFAYEDPQGNNRIRTRAVREFIL